LPHSRDVPDHIHAFPVVLLAVLVAFLTIASGFNPAAALATQPPIAAYSFDAGEGTVAEDSAGEHDGTIEGAEWTSGKYGGALKFNGESSCVSIPESPDLPFTEEFTLEAWVRPSGEGIQAILTQEDEAAGEEEEPFAYSLLVGGEEEGPKGWLRKGGESGHAGVGGGEPLSKNAWSHLALTDDGARIRIYVDGELAGNQPAILLTAANGPLTIGCLAGYGNYFQGRIDEVRIYNRALEPGEVAVDKAAPIQTPRAGPIAAYSFDEGEGETAEDLTGDGHTATIEGATWARGKYGAALEFDGENDCISIPESAELQFLEDEEFTLEAWVRPGGENTEAIITQEDDSAGGEEEPFAYSMLVGEEESAPRGWLRKGGESGHLGVSGGGELPRYAWSHIAFTDDGAKIRVYLDGELIATETAIPFTDAEGPLTIGCLDNYGNYFKGRIDEVRIYNRALDPGEVAADKTAPIQTPQAGPIAAYSFDEGEGEIAEDITGAGHTATLEGAEWTARGRYGSALEFDGEEDCVSIPESPDLPFTEEFTLEAWVRPSGEGIQAILTQEDEAAGEEEEPFAYSLLVGGEEEGPKGWLRKGGESGHIGFGGPDPLPQNAWSHLALTDDGAKLRLYVDGELVGSRAAIPLTAAEGPLTIGCLDNYGNYFSGRIDEVRVYDRALEAGEIGNDRASPIETPQQSPIAIYSFNEGEGTTLKDLTGNGHDGAIEGAAWVHGKYGGALQFDGENDCVSVPESAQLQFLQDEEFTFEAWVRPSKEEQLSAILTQEDEGFDEETEEAPYAYTMLTGAEEAPRAWLRKGGETGHVGFGGGETPGNTWTHIAFTDDGAHLRFYVEGELVSTEPAIPLTGAEGPLTIGCLAEFGNYFEGRIDEVRIYNRALDAGEVAADKATPLETPQQPPVAAYSFDEGEGATVEDLTGNGHTATIEGAAWTTHGRYGGALQFDGENDCVSVPESAEFQFLQDEEFTFEAWVRPQGENTQAIVTQEDDSAAEGEEPFAYSLLIGEEESAPRGWLRKGGEAGHVGVSGPGQLPYNAWSHIAFTDDGARIRVYLDGELIGTEPSIPLTSAEGPLTIGCLDNYGNYFDGRIDEVRIYDRALEAGEIASGMGPLPTVETTEAYGVNASEAAFVGTVDPQGEETTYRFQYGVTTAYGQTAPEDPELTEETVNGSEVMEVEEPVDTLEPETTYHYRIVATNNRGTVVGKDLTLTTTAATTPLSQLEAERQALLAERPSWKGFVNLGWSGNLSQDASEGSMKLIQDSGSKMFRVAVGVPNGTYDTLFQHAAEQGITILPDISGIPDTKGNLIPPVEKGTPGRASWEKKLKDIVNRYGPGGTFWKEHSGLSESLAPEYWEIWNEPNYGANGNLNEHIDPDRYGELLAISHAVITKIKPGAKILFGGLLAVSREKGKAAKMTVGQFIRRVGHAEDYAALSLHPYAFRGVGKDPTPTTKEDVQHVTKLVERNIRAARMALDSVGAKGKEIWITELGWPVKQRGLAEEDQHHLLVSEETQRELLNATFNMIKERSGPKDGSFNIESVFYYNVKDHISGDFPQIWDHHCGLIEDEGHGEKGGKRKAWFAFQNQAK
jgi:Concanavalin A-like lectin/glucanases superfamily